MSVIKPLSAIGRQDAERPFRPNCVRSCAVRFRPGTDVPAAGEVMVSALFKEADQTFRLVRLSTDTEAAAALYLQLDFRAIEDDAVTHATTL